MTFFVRLIKRDKYYLLLAVQLLFLLIMPFIEINTTAAGIFNVFGLSLIMLAGLNLVEKKQVIMVGRVITILFILLVIFVHFKEYPQLYFFTFILFFGLFLVVDAKIILMLLMGKTIKPSLIAGSVAGYLMIGISLAFFIMAFSGIAGEVLSDPIAELGFHGLIYYAFVTMTTIGYGEITPVHPVIQTTSIIAGVLSQFYMAVVVAVIVGKLMNKKA